MKATDLLRAQHKDVKTLFGAIEASKDDDEKEELFEQLATVLVAHDAIEREIFYPECEEQLGMDDMLGEALVEHGVVEFCLFRADAALGSENFEAYLAVLKEVVEHHVKEEEHELFPKVEKTFDNNLLEDLGDTMESRFADAMAEDFRGPLVSNLQQVLAGSLKTEKEPPPKKRATPKKTSKKAKAKHTNGHARAHH